VIFSKNPTTFLGGPNGVPKHTLGSQVQGTNRVQRMPKLLWKSGYPWMSLDVHGYAWMSMDIHGYACICMDMHGYQLIYTDIDGYPRIAMKSVDLHRYP